MRLIDYLSLSRGLAAYLARTIGVHQVTVSQWAHGKKQVPAERCPAIERATGGRVRCEDLRPDVDWAILRRGQPKVKPVATEVAE